MTSDDIDMLMEELMDMKFSKSILTFDNHEDADRLCDTIVNKGFWSAFFSFAKDNYPGKDLEFLTLSMLDPEHFCDMVAEWWRYERSTSVRRAYSDEIIQTENFT